MACRILLEFNEAAFVREVRSKEGLERRAIQFLARPHLARPVTGTLKPALAFHHHRYVLMDSISM